MSTLTVSFFLKDNAKNIFKIFLQRCRFKKTPRLCILLSAAQTVAVNSSENSSPLDLMVRIYPKYCFHEWQCQKCDRK